MNPQLKWLIRIVKIPTRYCAIIYIVKEGVTWCGLPHDFPKWQDVYCHFRKWGKTDETGISAFDKAMQELVISERIIKGHEAKTSMVIVDSKSIKNTDIPEEKGYDGCKKVSGIKLHIGAEVEIAKRSELHKFDVIPKRWVAERTFAWLEKYCCLWKNCEHLISNSLQMTIIAFIRLFSSLTAVPKDI